MYKIALFGVGAGSDKVINMLDFNKVEIVAYLDNNFQKQNAKKNNIIILNPNKILNISYDYIILTSQYYEQMKNQLIELGVPKEKIIEKISFLYKYEFTNINKLDLKNNDFSLISDDCCGGYVYNFLGKRYTSPFIWTWLKKDEYIKLLENLDEYLKKEIVFKNSNAKYPIGYLEDIEIHFMHYKTNDEAKQSWTERLKRINFSNMYLKFTCDDENLIRRYGKLPFKNKVCFTRHQYKNYKFCVCLEELKDTCTSFEDGALAIFEKYFNFLDWFNGKNPIRGDFIDK